jgi:SAM-dependent methyltransferase
MATDTNVVALDGTQIMKPHGEKWSRYIRNGIGLNLSRIGERFKIGWLTYNKVVMELFHSMALENAPKVADAILDVFPGVRSLIDVGAGSGAFAAEFTRRGLRVVGLEHSIHGINLARQQGVDCHSLDLEKFSPSQTTLTADLVYSFEVAEHLPPSLADKFVNVIMMLGPIVVFTAAHLGQGGIGHINEQPLNYWIRRFEQGGFDLSEVETERLRESFRNRGTSLWFSANAAVFRRRTFDPA